MWENTGNPHGPHAKAEDLAQNVRGAQPEPTPLREKNTGNPHGAHAKTNDSTRSLRGGKTQGAHMEPTPKLRIGHEG